MDWHGRYHVASSSSLWFMLHQSKPGGGEVRRLERFEFCLGRFGLTWSGDVKVDVKTADSLKHLLSPPGHQHLENRDCLSHHCRGHLVWSCLVYTEWVDARRGKYLSSQEMTSAAASLLSPSIPHSERLQDSYHRRGFYFLGFFCLFVFYLLTSHQIS